MKLRKILDSYEIALASIIPPILSHQLQTGVIRDEILAYSDLKPVTFTASYSVLNIQALRHFMAKALCRYK